MVFVVLSLKASGVLGGALNRPPHNMVTKGGLLAVLLLSASWLRLVPRGVMGALNRSRIPQDHPRTGTQSTCNESQGPVCGSANTDSPRFHVGEKLVFEVKFKVFRSTPRLAK
jgi:hypothetical protein